MSKPERCQGADVESAVMIVDAAVVNVDTAADDAVFRRRYSLPPTPFWGIYCQVFGRSCPGLRCIYCLYALCSRPCFTGLIAALRLFVCCHAFKRLLASKTTLSVLL